MLTNRNSEFAPVALLDLMKRRGRTWLLPYWAKGLKDKESRLVTNPARIYRVVREKQKTKNRANVKTNA